MSGINPRSSWPTITSLQTIRSAQHRPRSVHKLTGSLLLPLHRRLSTTPSTAPIIPAALPVVRINPFNTYYHRVFSTSSRTMSDLPLFRELTAPNGTKWNQPLGLFINNEFVKSKSGSTLSSISPIDDKEITTLYAAEEADVDEAVKAARAAFHDSAWADITPEQRGRLIHKLADLIEQHSDTLAAIDTWDMGKPLSVMKEVDMPESISTFRYYAGWADKISGKTLNIGPQKLVYTLHQPVGVCGQIIPWNYPFIMASWKLGPALACGNTIVMKTAEQSPLSVLFFCQLIKEAGFPPGVVNVLTGYGRTAGHAIAAHPNIDKIAFTGSTNTARDIMKTASVNLKNITLETGGKSPMLVFDDADIDQAVKWGHIGIMSNSGQVCCATSRILVQESIYEKFIDLFNQYTKKISVLGDPFSGDTTHGPQVSRQQYERVLAYVEKGKKDGAILVSGGEHPEVNFVAPTIFRDVEDHHVIYQEEVFGPFVVIGKFKTEEEGVKRANATTYGLGAAVFTKDIARAHKVAAKIDSGMVWINSSNDSHFAVPFGGVKQSGIGRECGEYALDSYTTPKAVFVDLGTVL
ncbi:aldehyde dehydrogenase-like protein [Ascodesmis nigricans]|uniref:Aldehyde dehydrogenase-like protein n=1 Tax=Ascodesmis nigricans TaxID=341454 RepID=A0A4S2MHP6_9PEZI|nr:aldehyde dehydrogenase-like protein [Ascodesmis nigricans]